MIVERAVLERRVQTALEAARIPVLLGSCGSGRTSTLLRLAGSIAAGPTQYLDLAAAATTPERCYRTVTEASEIRPSGPAPAAPDSPRAAFDALFTFFDQSASGSTNPPTFLLDEFLELRTFENFPGLRQVHRDAIARLASSPARFVLASRFTSRTHRLLRDAPSRFEVVHVPPLDVQETGALARAVAGPRHGWVVDMAPAVATLCAGRAAYVNLVIGALVEHGPAIDPVGALALLLAPEGRLTARCRQSYELRLHRARGYGALKAILGILAEDEPLTLTEISRHLRRTPGSTKDYLSWLEDVDLIRSRGKRYSFDDPILRLYVQLYGRPVPATDADIVRDVRAYARAVLPQTREQPPAPAPVEVAVSAAEPPADGRVSGIIEID
jgi:hypothetical protein